MATFTPELFLYLLLILLKLTLVCDANDILGCGGFVKSHVTLDFSKIEIGLYTKQGSLKEKTECAPTNGYYFLPLYDKGDYILKVHPPAGWSFEPSEVDISVDGESDQCSTGQDINFSFNGFGITGKVITAGQKHGPSGINVQLVNDKGDVRNTATGSGGNFHFTPVIPGKYTVKASHPRWKLEPSQAVVQVKEGNTALPFGVLAVKGYDVTGSITSFGSPIGGLYVLLYSKTEPKFRVEGCNTALLQGVPDAPICHSVTDNAGEFKFGVVPAGEYKLLVLATPPGQVAVTYNVKPDNVVFTVQHDSLYIKNAFEVTGFTIVGTVLKAIGGAGVSGARVLLDGKPIGNSDGAGKFTLTNMQPGVYVLGFQHEQSEFEEVQVNIPATGPQRAVTARASRWRVCGSVGGGGPGGPGGPARRVLVAPEAPHSTTVHTVYVTPADDGKWCTYLPPGVYSARVEVSEQEQREGLQFYPVSQKVSVGHGAVEGVAFSQLKGTLEGRVECLPGAKACRDVPVTLRPLSPDGGYVGQPLYTQAKDGEYRFEEVLPGSVEVSVSGERLCWAEGSHNVAVGQQLTVLPAFRHAGYPLRLHVDHPLEVEYESGSVRGVWNVRRGASRQCVATEGVYTLTPRGCHRFQPPVTTVDTAAPKPTTVHFVAVAHAVVIKVMSPESVTDLMLSVDIGGRVEEVGPLKPERLSTGGYGFEHTLYMADGEVCVVSARSSQLLFQPSGPQQVVGRGDCQPDGLLLRAVKGLTLAGRILPPVEGVTVTLTSESVSLSVVTDASGTYRFGPLDASQKYTVSAHKDSYVFAEPNDSGDIVANKLAEITVELLDDADSTPLQGALVSVSGGPYRRNAASGADGRLRFGSLSPAQYYVKPHMKEYRFAPPHHIVPLQEGTTHHITLRGVRVAWSCVGRIESHAGAAWGGAALLARPRAQPDRCAPSDASAAPDGAFRIRGLLPNCQYTIELKESTVPELAGLKLAKAPPIIEIIGNKDIENVRLIAVQPQQITDAHVLVRTANVDHYRLLRLSLALEAAPHSPLYATKLDPAGFAPHRNPGLLYVLPRLPADNKTYILQLDSTLSKATHVYDDEIHYFNSDGNFKHFTIEFVPKVRSSEQEVRQTSLLVAPLVAALALGWLQRARLQPALAAFTARLLGHLSRAPARGTRAQKPQKPTLDQASIDHIVNAVNATGKKPPKKKVA